MGNGPLQQPPQQGAPQPGSAAPTPPMGTPQAGGQAMNPPQMQAGPPPQGGPAAALAQPDPSMGNYGADQDTDADEKIEGYIDYALTQTNLAKKLQKGKKGKATLALMGTKIIEGIEADEKSRSGWMELHEEWMKLAMLVKENKTFPWPKASNVKYPLLATAAMQFSARAYPALVPSDGHVVKTKIVQRNPEDQIYQAAENISQHMSYQVMECIPDWEENMDKLLMTMAITGIAFKKTYYNALDKCLHSDLIYPNKFIVNYHAKSLKDAYRKTEILEYNDNEVRERVKNDEEFLDLEFTTPTGDTKKASEQYPATGITPPPVDSSTPHVFLACHTYWDLDDDGYEEPYIVTIHRDTKQVVRIIARWCSDGVKKNADKEIVKIAPVEYFTAFPFIPNPDGSIYALGFGLLLGPLNESTNSIINQLIDAGTLSNMPSGFIGKGLRLRMGQTSLQPGEFKVVNATAEDLQKGVFVMPFKEPSSVLYQLLQMLITSGNQLASIAEIFVGKMPGQNTPATTTQETIQQGMAVFTAIYKRVYRSLAEEFKKIYWLNSITPNLVEEESKVAGIQMQASDYALPEWVVLPAADPTGDSASTKMAKLQQVGQLLQMGTIDPMVYTRRMLDANEIPNAQELIRQPSPPPPDPKVQTEQLKQTTEQLKQQGMQQKSQQEQQKGQQDLALKQQDMELKHREKQQEMAFDAQSAEQKLHADQVRDATKQHGEMQKMHLQNSALQQKSHIETMAAHAKATQELSHSEQAHKQTMQQTGQMHKQTLTLEAQRARQQAKQQAKAPKATPSK